MLPAGDLVPEIIGVSNTDPKFEQPVSNQLSGTLGKVCSLVNRYNSKNL
jgi:hypothetical protein